VGQLQGGQDVGHEADRQLLSQRHAERLQGLQVSAPVLLDAVVAALIVHHGDGLGDGGAVQAAAPRPQQRHLLQQQLQLGQLVALPLLGGERLQGGRREQGEGLDDDGPPPRAGHEEDGDEIAVG
jgi:hypothetical protein